MTIRYTLDNIDAVATQLLNSFESKIILFNGEMGSGKTTLIAALVRALGGISKTSSPTFSIVNEYKVDSDFVYHFDFYRIKNHYEALDIGVEDYFCSGYWNFIEWPEKIESLLPDDVTVVYITIESDNIRQLECVYSKNS
jgi:tRNA threonylcarbamoyladenosine biosynthesis protein TsaE